MTDNQDGNSLRLPLTNNCHDDVIKWKHFPRYWPFVRGIHRSPVNSPHKGQWRGALMFSLICVWINGWVNNREAGDLRHYRAHYGVTVMHFNCLLSESEKGINENINEGNTLNVSIIYETEINHANVHINLISYFHILVWDWLLIMYLFYMFAKIASVMVPPSGSIGR